MEFLERALDIADGCIDASPIAMWCIEYSEPVDVTASEEEVVRQVFENDCHWRMCNRAMARLYNLPEELDFNRQRVSSYFPRSPENEAFIRQAIYADFSIDGAAAVDVRHDGTLMHVENSVRSRVEDGKMVRMWGTVRDITESRLAHNRLLEREQEVSDILSALPDAVVVLDSLRRVVALNPAFEATFGWPAEAVLGKDLTPIVDVNSERANRHRPSGQYSHRWRAGVMTRGGTALECDIRMGPLRQHELIRGLVLSIRPAVETPGATKRARVKSRRTR